MSTDVLIRHHFTNQLIAYSFPERSFMKPALRLIDASVEQMKEASRYGSTAGRIAILYPSVLDTSGHGVGSVMGSMLHRTVAELRAQLRPLNISISLISSAIKKVDLINFISNHHLVSSSHIIISYHHLISYHIYYTTPFSDERSCLPSRDVGSRGRWL